MDNLQIETNRTKLYLANILIQCINLFVVIRNIVQRTKLFNKEEFQMGLVSVHDKLTKKLLYRLEGDGAMTR